MDKDEAVRGDDYSKEAIFARLLSKACRWVFLSDSEGNFYKEIVYSKFGEVLYVYNITNNLSGLEEDKSSFSNKSLRGSFYDKNGIPIVLRNNGAQVMSVAYDANGYEKQIQFFDAKDNPCSSFDKAYGVLYEHDNIGRLKSVKLLDQLEDLLDPDSCRFNCRKYHYLGLSAKISTVTDYLLTSKFCYPVSIAYHDIEGRDSITYFYLANGQLMPDTSAIIKYRYNGFYCSSKEYLTILLPSFRQGLTFV